MWRFTIVLLATACTEGPWLERGSQPRFEGGELIEAVCEDDGDHIRVRIDATYDIRPSAIDDEVSVAASFELDRTILDGRPHELRGVLRVNSEYCSTFPYYCDAVFTPGEGHDPAIHHAIAYPYGFGSGPERGSVLELSATLTIAEPCPTGSIHLRTEGDATVGGTVEAFMPLEPHIRF
jgi:hypothetical protein